MSLADMLAAVAPGSPEEALVRGVDFDRLPRHVAIIMDGNGRWAAAGICRASKATAPASTPCATRSRPPRASASRVLTLYAFSVENWKRPDTEISALMGLLKHYLRLELKTLLKNNIRFHVIGQRDRLSPDIRDELETAEARTRDEHRHAVQHRAELRRPRRDRRRRAARDSRRRRPGRARRSGRSRRSSTRPASPIRTC